MPTPSKGFVATLQLMDSALSLRWGESVGKWVVERKAVIPQQELMYLQRRRERTGRFAQDEKRPAHKREVETYRGLTEEVISAKDGKRVVLFADELTPRIFDMLAFSDMQRYGGYSRMADKLDELDEERDALIEKELSSKRENLNREVFDMLNFIWNKKETKLLHGEKNLGMLLHGKQSTEPLIKHSEL